MPKKKNPSDSLKVVNGVLINPNAYFREGEADDDEVNELNANWLHQKNRTESGEDEQESEGDEGEGT